MVKEYKVYSNKELKEINYPISDGLFFVASYELALLIQKTSKLEICEILDDSDSLVESSIEEYSKNSIFSIWKN